MSGDEQLSGFTPISWLRFSCLTALTTTWTASNISAADSWGRSQGEHAIRVWASAPSSDQQPCCGSYRGPRVRTDPAAVPPGQAEAPDEVQVEGVAAVEHGEAQDVGLVPHHIVQPQQREVL